MPYHRVRARDRLAALLEAGLRVGSELDLSTVLTRIAEAASQIADARYVAIGVLDPSGAGLSDFVTVGIDDATRAAIGPPPEGRGVLGVLIDEPQSLRLADLSRHPASSGLPRAHPKMTSFLGVPIRVKDMVFGNLYLTDKIGAPEFSEEDEDLVTTLGLAAGIALENARLLEQSTDLTMSLDRERIARDLHDLVIQRLFATGLSLQAAANQAAAERTGGPEADSASSRSVARRLEHAIDDIDDVIRQIRTTIFALGDQRAPGRSVRSDILTITREAAAVLGFEPRLSLSGPIDTVVSGTLAEHLLAVLREGVSNVVQHAGATSLEVRVEAGELVAITIEDDGVGFGPDANQSGHGGGRGVANMSERARLLGGSLTLEPHAPRGTVLRWSVPRRVTPSAAADPPKRPPVRT